MKGDNAYLDDEEMELDVELPPVVADDHDSRKRAEAIKAL